VRRTAGALGQAGPALGYGRTRSCGHRTSRPDPGRPKVADAMARSEDAQRAKAIAKEMSGFRAIQVCFGPVAEPSALVKAGLGAGQALRASLPPTARDVRLGRFGDPVADAGGVVDDLGLTESAS